jgi:chromate transporter
MVDAAMKADFGILVTLAAHFAFLSLFAIGGANAAIPEMHRLAVEVMHWMSDRQFADMFAIAQLAPGPNVIIVTLIGYHVAGIAGAIVTTTAMCGPTCFFAYFVGRAWERFKDAPWRIAIQSGLVPVSIGLVAASAYLIARTTGQGWITLAITLATAALAYWTRINPLWMFAAAASLGLAGLI